MQLVNYKQIDFFFNRYACQAFNQSINQSVNKILILSVLLHYWQLVGNCSLMMCCWNISVLSNKEGMLLTWLICAAVWSVITCCLWNYGSWPQTMCHGVGH